jgi:hypothetical protein
MAVKNLNPWAKYSKATTKKQFRTVGMSSGEVGSGKTRFWLTAPGPILVLSMDKGLEGVVEDILNEMPDKEVFFVEYEWNPQDERWDSGEESAQEYAKEVRAKIMEDMEFGLKNARTLLFDKETDIREVIQYAEFGGPTEGNLRDWGKLNQRYFHMLNRVKSVEGINVGFIQSMKDEWNLGTGGRGKTGKRVRAGWDRLDECVFTELHHVRKAGEFVIEIGKCRQNGSMQDTEIPGMDFAEFGTLLIDGTERSDWE